METLGNFHFNLTYHPGCELLQADALSCIYVQQSKSDGALDFNWPMVYPLIKNNSYLKSFLQNFGETRQEQGHFQS